MRANFTDFRLLCGKYNPIACYLQETMDDFVFRGFNCIHLTSDIDVGTSGGVSSTIDQLSFIERTFSSSQCLRYHPLGMVS